MRETKGGSATADYGKTASFLAIGVGLTGLITYVYFLVASHVLSKPYAACGWPGVWILAMPRLTPKCVV